MLPDPRMFFSGTYSVNISRPENTTVCTEIHRVLLPYIVIFSGRIFHGKVTAKRCYDIGGSDIGGSDIGGPDIGGFLATLEALSKKDIGGLATLEAC